jgi:hypothetical protein
LSTVKTQRDYEYDYLGLAYQIEDLLQKKIAAYAIESEIQATHQILLGLAQQILNTEDPRELEYEYLAATYKMQELLQQKTKAFSMRVEFQQLQGQLAEVGGKLGWDRDASPADSLKSISELASK